MKAIEEYKFTITKPTIVTVLNTITGKYIRIDNAWYKKVTDENELELLGDENI